MDKKNLKLLKIFSNPIKAAKEAAANANFKTERQEALIRKILKKDKK